MADKTEDRINAPLPAGGIDPMTRFVATNATYFKSDWVNPFDKTRLRTLEFRTVSGTTVKVPMTATDG